MEAIREFLGYYFLGFYLILLPGILACWVGKHSHELYLDEYEVEYKGAANQKRKRFWAPIVAWWAIYLLVLIIAGIIPDKVTRYGILQILGLLALPLFPPAVYIARRAVIFNRDRTRQPTRKAVEAALGRRLTPQEVEAIEDRIAKELDQKCAALWAKIPTNQKEYRYEMAKLDVSDAILAEYKERMRREAGVFIE